MDSAGPISWAFFLWAQPTMRKGFGRPLQEDEALRLPARLNAAVVRRRFEELWALELQRAEALSLLKKQEIGPSTLHVLLQLSQGDLILAVSLQVIAVCCKFACVLLLRRIVQIVLVQDDEQRGEGLGIAFGLFALNALEGSIGSHASHRMQLALYSAFMAVAQAVLRKGSMLHPDVQDKFRRGDLVTLALSDFSRLIDMSNVLMLGIGAPFMLLFAFVFLGVLLGPLVLADFVVVLVAGYLISRVAGLQGSSFRQKMMWQGRRIAVLNEMLQSVRFIKYYVLEDHYEAQMVKHRCQEESKLFGMKGSMALVWPLASLVPTLTSVVCLGLYIMIHGALPPTEDTLAVMAIARFLFAPFAFFGGCLGGFNMLRSACSRLGLLLRQPEVARQLMLPPPPPEEKAEKGDDLAVRIVGQSFSWTLNEDDKPAVKKLTLEVPRGELWAIVGELGSGKSSILAALMGCMSVVSQDSGPDKNDKPAIYTSGASRSYVGQMPMIMNATLRNNVLFGLSAGTEEAKVKLEADYSEALAVSALLPDLEVLPGGDQTEIGEKGITLSGGQKARVALARAVMAAQPGGLVLLDDPLAAVDAHVGHHIFHECIVGALAGTTRLLVTNQLHFLSHANVARVIVMKAGELVEQGTFAELAAQPSSNFSKMVSSVGGSQKQKDESKVEQKAPEKAVEAKIKVVNTGNGELVKKENKREGVVTWATFQFWFAALGGIRVFLMLAMFSWMFHLAELAPDIFLVGWQMDFFTQETSWYFGIWVGISLFGFGMLIFSRFSWVYFTLKASRKIQSSMLRRVMHCPMGFFDTTPSGRIINRLGEDQMQIDFTLPLNFEVLCISSWQVVDQLAVGISCRPWVGVFVLVFGVLFMLMREIYRRTSREMIRWWMVTKSPVFNIFEETLSGSTTIFAFQREDYFGERFEKALQVNMEWLMSRDVANLWTEQRLQWLASLVVGVLAVLMVMMPSAGASPQLTALGLIYALQLGFSLKTASYFLVAVEGVFASVERVMEFTNDLQQEPPWQMPADAALVQAKWPQDECSLVFEDVCVRYLPHLPRALDGFSVSLKAREKVGLVGRTGSGKSTVMGTLFRLMELESGRILLGGVDIAGVGVGHLRRQITIVPQDPILFSGELRKNLDPLGVRTDAELWAALKGCSLSAMVESLEGGLSAKVAEGGINFSVGERQVLCLARALLRESRILCLDEATANVDPTNDKRIQQVLSQGLQDCLVLTIAHRLHTVLRSDRILVLERGYLAQSGPPATLLAQPGIFKELANQAGIYNVNSDSTLPTQSEGEAVKSI
ncbi:unnamed protein product [Polarella glacialis]|uniref:ATP-dependent transporter ycf16 n=1 Tax=Polarella glacialis TaxID=89957 RepID=A0A813K289_POLGL|nr:unnamed protein product [Polarella glacialis]